jgi:hypothetical protein
MAFQLNQMIPGLNLDVGIKIPFEITDRDNTQWVSWMGNESFGSFGIAKFEWMNTKSVWGKQTAQRNYSFSAGLVYQMDIGDVKNALTINTRLDTKFGGSYTTRYLTSNATDFQAMNTEIRNPMELDFHIWPEYNLGFIIVGFDLGYIHQGAHTQKVPAINVNGTLNYPYFFGDTVNRVPEEITFDGKKQLTGKLTDGWSGGGRFGFGFYARKNLAPNTFFRGGIAYTQATKVDGIREKGAVTIPIGFEARF